MILVYKVKMQIFLLFQFYEEEEFREGCFAFWKTAWWLSVYKNLNLYLGSLSNFVTNYTFSELYITHFPTCSMGVIKKLLLLRL